MPVRTQKNWEKIIEGGFGRFPAESRRRAHALAQTLGEESLPSTVDSLVEEAPSKGELPASDQVCARVGVDELSISAYAETLFEKERSMRSLRWLSNGDASSLMPLTEEVFEFSVQYMKKNKNKHMDAHWDLLVWLVGECSKAFDNSADFRVDTFNRALAEKVIELFFWEYNAPKEGTIADAYKALFEARRKSKYSTIKFMDRVLFQLLSGKSVAEYEGELESYKAALKSGQDVYPPGLSKAAEMKIISLDVGPGYLVEVEFMSGRGEGEELETISRGGESGSSGSPSSSASTGGSPVQASLPRRERSGSRTLDRSVTTAEWNELVLGREGEEDGIATAAKRRLSMSMSGYDLQSAGRSGDKSPNPITANLLKMSRLLGGASRPSLEAAQSSFDDFQEAFVRTSAQDDPGELLCAWLKLQLALRTTDEGLQPIYCLAFEDQALYELLEAHLLGVLHSGSVEGSGLTSKTFIAEIANAQAKIAEASELLVQMEMKLPTYSIDAACFSALEKELKVLKEKADSAKTETLLLGMEFGNTAERAGEQKTAEEKVKNQIERLKNAKCECEKEAVFLANLQGLKMALSRLKQPVLTLKLNNASDAFCVREADCAIAQIANIQKEIASLQRLHLELPAGPEVGANEGAAKLALAFEDFLDRISEMGSVLKEALIYRYSSTERLFAKAYPTLMRGICDELERSFEDDFPVEVSFKGGDRSQSLPVGSQVCWASLRGVPPAELVRASSERVLPRPGEE